MGIREERRGEFRPGIQSQEDQESTVAEAEASVITQTSSESQIGDVTNKDIVDRYLRVFLHVRTS